MKPRLLHVISTPEGIGGAEVVMLAVLEHGKARDWDQLVLNPFDRNPKGSALTKRVESLGVAYEGISSRHVWHLGRARRWIQRNVLHFGPDVTLAFLFHSSVLVGLMGQSRSVRILSHQHGDYFHASGRRVAERIDRFVGRRFDHVIACSDWAGRFLTSRYGYPEAMVSVVRNGWTGEPQVGREQVPGRPVVFVCVANFRPEKDHATLIGAFDRVLSENRAVRLRLVGEGPLEDEVRGLVENLNLTDRVDFLGRVDNVWEPLAESDIFVLASQSEQLGIAVLEAMAASLPIVATNVGGVSELVCAESTGRLVPSGDQAHLARAMLDLASRPDERRRMGKEGAKRASAMTMERTVAGYFEIFESYL